MRGPNGVVVATAGAGAFACSAAMRASAGEAPMADDIGLDRRDLDLVVFADQLRAGSRAKQPAARLANARRVVSKLVGIVRQPPVMRLMAGLRPAGTRVLPLFLLVRRRRLGRRARILIGTLKPKHQLDQLLLAEPLQITSVHPGMDSEIPARGKGVGNYPVR